MLFQIPFDYGMSGVTGLKYQAIKDFCKWYGLKPLVKYVPLIIKLGSYYASQLNKK